MLYADGLTSEQKTKARIVVELYCNFLSDYARSSSFMSNYDSIRHLFPTSGTFAEIYDDIQTEKYIYISAYLDVISRIYFHSLTFTYENIASVNIESFESPSPDNSQIIYAQLEVEKTIEGDGFYKKKVKNIFMVNSKNNKIHTVLDSASISDLFAYSLWYKGMKYYKDKKYENALDCFKKAGEMGDPESMYYCGVMYFTNKGCGNERDENGKKLNRRKRDAKAYEWYKKAEQHGHEEAHRQIMIFY